MRFICRGRAESVISRKIKCEMILEETRMCQGSKCQDIFQIFLANAMLQCVSRSPYISLYTEVSHLRHDRPLGPDRSLREATVLCFAGVVSISGLYPLHGNNTFPTSCGKKNVSKHCQMSSQGTVTLG